MGGSGLVVACIPAYNEEKTIAKVVLQTEKFVNKVIVCDDGSTDMTAEIAEKMGAMVVRHRGQEGYGAALKTAFLAAIAFNPSVVVTLDAEGSILHAQGREHRIPVIPVEAVDPTGAGDAYRAGFLAAYHRGHTPLTSCRVGAVTASFVVERAGCQTHLPDWNQMVARYWTHFGDLPAPEGNP